MRCAACKAFRSLVGRWPTACAMCDVEAVMAMQRALEQRGAAAIVECGGKAVATTKE
jgi:hypothetical protein